MSAARRETHPLAEEAAHWVVELEEPTPQVLRAFAAWLEASPRHVEEFLLASAVWKELDGLDAARRIDVQRLVEEARSNVRVLAPETIREPAREVPERSPARRRMLGAIGAAAALVAGIALWLVMATAPDVYATSRGEQRAFRLDDGSIVHLNTQSRVEVKFSRKERRIRLLEGEALFTVEHDPARPFRVIAGPTVIEAVGTRFNVYRTAAGTTVSVVEGIVEISPTILAALSARAAPPAGSGAPPQERPAPAVAERVAAGEQARVSYEGEIVKETVPDLARVVAWRERRLVFRGDPLEEVVREFNRYNELQIRLEGDALRARRLTGVFDADDPISLLQFLTRDGTLTVDESGGDDIVIRER